jgi:hypothetical protein
MASHIEGKRLCTSMMKCRTTGTKKLPIPPSDSDNEPELDSKMEITGGEVGEETSREGKSKRKGSIVGSSVSKCVHSNTICCPQTSTQLAKILAAHKEQRADVCEQHKELI